MQKSNPRGLRIDPIETAQFGRSSDRDTTDDRGSESEKIQAGAGASATEQSTRAPDKRIVTDGGERSHGSIANALTGFQEDVLYVLAEDARYGQAVKEELEAVYGSDVNHGRLYPNLNALVDLGLASKTPRNQRSNVYAITDRGMHYVRERSQQRLGRLGLDVVDERRAEDASVRKTTIQSRDDARTDGGDER